MRLLRLSHPQAEQMFKRMEFNVIARNCDDHTKNFAFRLRKGHNWELAPAYDICFAYRPDNDWVSQHNLSINGKRRNITKEDLLAIAKSMNIKKAKAIIEQINETVKNWFDFAEQVNMETKLKEKIGGLHLVL
jgi:serine/threonine-protein kinase HipA